MNATQALEAALQFGFARAVMLPADPVVEYAPAPSDMRVAHIDPHALLPGARSVLVMAMPFAWHTPWPQGTAEVSAYYFHSQVAHVAMRGLAAHLEAQGVAVSTDQHLPLKLLGRNAGYGVMGRNCLLRNDAWGTCFALRLLVTDIAPKGTLPPPMPATPCGDCTRCAKACPTDALLGNGRLNTARCMRVHMLSGRPVPEALRAPMGQRLLGCEICQRACPHNRYSASMPPPQGPFGIDQLLTADRAVLDALGALIGRNEARRLRIQAQAALVAGNTGSAAYLPPLEALAAGGEPAVQAHAAWAIDQIRA